MSGKSDTTRVYRRGLEDSIEALDRMRKEILIHSVQRSGAVDQHQSRLDRDGALDIVKLSLEEYPFFVAEPAPYFGVTAAGENYRAAIVARRPITSREREVLEQRSGSPSEEIHTYHSLEEGAAVCRVSLLESLLAQRERALDDAQKEISAKTEELEQARKYGTDLFHRRLIDSKKPLLSQAYRREPTLLASYRLTPSCHDHFSSALSMIADGKTTVTLTLTDEGEGKGLSGTIQFVNGEAHSALLEHDGRRVYGDRALRTIGTLAFGLEHGRIEVREGYHLSGKTELSQRYSPQGIALEWLRQADESGRYQKMDLSG